MLSLTGEYQHVLDNKSRVLISNKLRNQIDADEHGSSFYLVLGTNGILCLYPQKYFDKIIRMMAPATSPADEAVAAERMGFGLSGKIELDGQGRLLINEALRKRAGLKNDLTLVGVRDHIELWNRESWDQYVEDHMAQYQNKMAQARQAILQQESMELDEL